MNGSGAAAGPASDVHGPDGAGGSKGIGSDQRLPSFSVSLDGFDDEQEDANGLEGLEEEADEVGQLSGDTGSGRLISASPPAAPSGEKNMSQMTPAERREHSRKHSRMHSRNLSVFFPRPGTEAESEADAIQAADTFRDQQQRVEGRPLVSVDTNKLGANPSTPQRGGGGLGADLHSSKSRRGHHRKHSVTHDYSTNEPSSASTSSSAGIPSPYSSHFETNSTQLGPNVAALPETPQRQRPAANAYAHHRKHSSSTGVAKMLSTPVTQLVASSALPPSHRPLLVFGTCHFVLGAATWMQGQSGDSLAMTGLGYLVVFDAFGILNAVTAEWLAAKWRGQQDQGHQLRKPYGCVVYWGEDWALMLVLCTALD